MGWRRYSLARNGISTPISWILMSWFFFSFIRIIWVSLFLFYFMFCCRNYLNFLYVSVKFLTALDILSLKLIFPSSRGLAFMLNRVTFCCPAQLPGSLMFLKMPSCLVTFPSYPFALALLFSFSSMTNSMYTVGSFNPIFSIQNNMEANRSMNDILGL